MDYIVDGLQLLTDFQLMDFQLMDYIVDGLQLLIDFQLMDFKLMDFLLIDLTEWVNLQLSIALRAHRLLKSVILTILPLTWTCRDVLSGYAPTCIYCIDTIIMVAIQIDYHWAKKAKRGNTKRCGAM